MKVDNYDSADPFGFQKNPDDHYRKRRIVDTLNMLFPDGFERALDIGAGEGWITKDLPAKAKYGMEPSEKARGRMPEGVIATEHPLGPYDLVTASGVIYPQYGGLVILEEAVKHCSKILLTTHIREWEMDELKSAYQMKRRGFEQIYEEHFPYRQYTGQQLRVFQKV